MLTFANCFVGKKVVQDNMDIDDSSPITSATNSTNTSPIKSNYKLQYQPYPVYLSPKIPPPPSDSDSDDEDSSSKQVGLPLTDQDPVIQVDAACRYSIAVTKKGKLYTWGSGHCYQLGNSEQKDEPLPYCVDLKDRFCFWGRCGGQFVMFLLGIFLNFYSSFLYSYINCFS